MNSGALFLIFFGIFLLFILFFIESGSSNNFSNPTPTLLFTTDSSTFSGGNPCLVFTEIFLTIIVIALLVVGSVMLSKPEQPNMQNYPVSNYVS